MPLATAVPGTIPASHERCGFDPCIACKADANLTEDDKAVMEFFSVVRDQVIEGHPGPEGQRVAYPRLEGWAAACDLYDVPQHRRARLVEMGRLVFDCVHERVTVEGIHRLPESEFTPLDDELLDG